MKKIKNIICIILILMLLATFIPTASYAMGDATGEFRVIGCEYTRKKSGSKLKSFSRLSVKITMSGGSVMDYKIVEKEAFEILEKVEVHSIENETNAKSIPDFWTRSHNDGTVKTLFENATDNTFIFGVCYGNNSDNAKTFNYSIGAICDENTIVPKGFRKNTIPARTWAVFECKGAMPKAIQDMWHKITAEFFPTSGYEPTYEMDIEAYTEGDMSSENYRSEIWIPVVRK